MPTILLLNHYLPPDPAPTGKLLGELGAHLESHGWSVVRIPGVDPQACYRTRSSHGKKRKLLGWISAHWRILRESLRAPKADIVLCLTDPPFLVITAALIACRHRARLAHWVMDLYPDLARELGELSRSLCALLKPAMRLAYRSCDLTIALDSAMSERLRVLGNRKLATVPPWVLSTTHLTTPAAKAASGSKEPADEHQTPSPDDPPPFTWLYSGNLGRAHLYEPLLQIQAEIESSGSSARLVFQGSGAMTGPASERAAQLGLRHCEFRGYAPDEELLTSLLAADVLVATLAEPLDGMLWPSKVALLKHLDRPLLWVGPPGDIAMLCAERLPASLAVLPQDWKTASAWLKTRVAAKAPLSVPGIRLPSVTAEREHSLTMLHDLLHEILPPAKRHSLPPSG